MLVFVSVENSLSTGAQSTAIDRPDQASALHKHKNNLPFRMLRMSKMEMKKPRSITILLMEMDMVA
jgi:hypothetical protein